VAFRGSFEFTLDAKNRLTIPVKFRGPFSDGVTLARMRDVSDCISIWCTPVFDAYVANLLESCHPLSEERETLARFYGANAHDGELDAAGRVIVPQRMLARPASSGTSWSTASPTGSRSGRATPGRP
jgi:MraZ protein